MPWPADYGGVIDVYYRIKALSESGVKVHLHCYTYGREEAAVLKEICEEVHYYPRKTGFLNQLRKKPYIVASRQSEQLVARLMQDDYPILLEGLHDCHVLEALAGKGRPIMVRAHNVEHDYYHALARAERSLWKRCFFSLEAWKLRRYEPVLKMADKVLAINEKDAAHFNAIGCNVEVMMPSHGHAKVTSLPGKGDYVLYHGNLSVMENVKALDFLLDNVFDCSYKVVVAGKDPGPELQARLAQKDNIALVANPSDQEMHQLLRDAHVNVLVTFQSTGVKLKLLNALYEGRYCLVNPQMVEGTDLGPLCCVEEDATELRQRLEQLMTMDFTQESISERQESLKKIDESAPIKNII